MNLFNSPRKIIEHRFEYYLLIIIVFAAYCIYWGRFIKRANQWAGLDLIDKAKS